MVACVRNCWSTSLFFAWAKSLPTSLTVRRYSSASTTRDSNSGNLFEYLSRTNRWITTENRSQKTFHREASKCK
ncbi:unnamed protein product, partial [Nesidiocoris tenuis]